MGLCRGWGFISCLSWVLTAASKGTLRALLGQGRAVQREKNAGKTEVRGPEMGKGGRVGQTRMYMVLQAALRTRPGPTDFKGEGGEAELLQRGCCSCDGFRRRGKENFQGKAASPRKAGAEVGRAVGTGEMQPLGHTCSGASQNSPISLPPNYSSLEAMKGAPLPPGGGSPSSLRQMSPKKGSITRL